MEPFNLKSQQWYVEDTALALIAREVGTPCYIYSKSALEQRWQSFQQAFKNHPYQINYAVKANSNLAVLNVLAKLGSGFDIVSGGELHRVLKAGGDPKKIIFSGVGKSAQELSDALKVGIGCINIESEMELSRLNEIAIALGQKAKIAFRINPNVDSKSHPYISTGLEENKFGIRMEDALLLYQQATELAGIEIEGLAYHIGSQITSLSPFIEALQKILPLVQSLKQLGIPLKHLDIGGGLGVCYQSETPPSPEEYIATLLAELGPLPLAIHIEPGRAIAAPAGVLLTRVEYIKKQGTQNKYFAIVDAAMNDLLRPALYNAWQEIIPIQPTVAPTGSSALYDIVGPVCETSDFLGKDRLLSIKAGDVLMIRNAGAYGFSMSSNYNSRPRVAEVMVEGKTFQIIRERETVEDLFRTEYLFTATK